MPALSIDKAPQAGSGASGVSASTIGGSIPDVRGCKRRDSEAKKKRSPKHFHKKMFFFLPQGSAGAATLRKNAQKIRRGERPPPRQWPCEGQFGGKIDREGSCSRATGGPE